MSGGLPGLTFLLFGVFALTTWNLENGAAEVTWRADSAHGSEALTLVLRRWGVRPRSLFGEAGGAIKSTVAGISETQNRQNLPRSESAGEDNLHG